MSRAADSLLKNRVSGRRGYLLLTEAALRWTGLDPARAGLVSHTERYEHFGDVRCFVKDLALGMALSAASGHGLEMEPALAD